MLAELIAAGLVSHEMIADPARLGGEAEALRLLCGLVAGPVWRIEPWHYAFRADPGGAPAARAAELEAALQAELGAERGLGQRHRAARGGRPRPAAAACCAPRPRRSSALEPAGPELTR